MKVMVLKLRTKSIKYQENLKKIYAISFLLQTFQQTFLNNPHKFSKKCLFHLYIASSNDF